MAPLTDMIEQAGHSMLAHRLVLLAAAVSRVVGRRRRCGRSRINPLSRCVAAAVVAARCRS